MSGTSATSRTARAAAALVLGALLALGGCAGPGAYRGSEAPTQSDNTPARNRAETHLHLAANYLQDGQTSVALDEAKEALEIDPTYVEAFNVAGIIYLTIGDNSRARSHFERALALRRNDPSALLNLGWLECSVANFDKADQLFEQALAAGHPDQAKVLQNQGVCQIRADRLQQAEATLRRSYELDAGNPITGYNLADLLYRRADYTDARFYVRRLNNSELANAESLWLGMRIEHKLGDTGALGELARQLQRRFPDSQEWHAYQQGRYDG